MFLSFKQHQQPSGPLLAKIKKNGVSILNVDSFKFLGVYVDKNLKWQNHINHFGNKLSQINGTVCRITTNSRWVQWRPSCFSGGSDFRKEPSSNEV